mmetsp:Transcript_1416/g.2181  ORF Transcript_1416/g.2181 Transcript_1416/m.2181 type:complete len:369 (+) Transcript_1416:147-1253(+)
MKDRTGYVGTSSFSLKDDYKTLRYLLPLVCDWVSTVQEDEVDENKFLAQLANGVILCRVLSLIKESGVSEEDFNDPCKSRQEAKENLQLFLDTSRKRLYFPSSFKFKDFNQDGIGDLKLYGNHAHSRVVECLVYLAKAASKHRHLRNQMPRELYNYVTKKVKVELAPPSVMKQISAFGAITDLLSKDDDGEVYFKEEVESDDGIDDIDSDSEAEGDFIKQWAKNAMSNRTLVIPTLAFGIIIGLLSGFVLSSVLTSKEGEVSTSGSGYAPFVCEKYEGQSERYLMNCTVDPKYAISIEGNQNLTVTEAGEIMNIGGITVKTKSLYFEILVQKKSVESDGVKPFFVVFAVVIGLVLGLAGTALDFSPRN